jgi:putative membrane protein
MLMSFLSEYYRWIKAFHIIAMIAWMAGMFYLPRLYVYHTQVEKGSAQSELFKVMERRLLRFIINPAMIVTIIFGILLLVTPNLIDWSAGWIHIKLAAVVLLTGFHGFLAKWRKAFERDANIHSEGFYRKMNEVPTILMIVIVIMVVVKPF